MSTYILYGIIAVLLIVAVIFIVKYFKLKNKVHVLKDKVPSTKGKQAYVMQLGNEIYKYLDMSEDGYVSLKVLEK